MAEDEQLPDHYVLNRNRELLLRPPSVQKGMSLADERMSRFYGCQYIAEASLMLCCSSSVAATAQSLFHKFYFRESLQENAVIKVAAAAIFLGAKVEEEPRHIFDVVQVFERMSQRKHGQQPRILNVHSDPIAFRMKSAIENFEGRILRSVGFFVHCEHPYKFIASYAQILRLGKEVIQQAWNYANDSFRSVACVRFRPEALAAACIHLAALRCGVSLPTNPAWILLCEVGEHELNATLMEILQIYSMGSPLNPLEKDSPPAVLKELPTIPMKNTDESEPSAEESQADNATDSQSGAEPHAGSAQAIVPKAKRSRWDTR